jgi:tetratricopeptide (TPR) repeat protein
LRLDPASPEAHYNMATTLAWQGRSDEAIAQLRQTLALAPEHVGAHVNLGALLRARGDRAGAVVQLQRALELAPRNAAAHSNLGGVLMQDGSVTRAVAEYRSALEAGPNLLEPLTELAWTLATSPDPALQRAEEAVHLAEHARSITGGKDIRVLDALGAAYAAAGRYADAAAAVQDALTLLPADVPGRQQTDRLLRDRLALYRQRTPFRDPSRVDR